MARNSITDPRIQAIMDQLNKKDDSNKESETKAMVVVQAAPPTTYSEFMKAEKLVRSFVQWRIQAGVGGGGGCNMVMTPTRT